jgi:uncharacterized membrane protein YoaK (UPF0700 family)
MTLIAIALTFGSGANDVASFTRLGGVFTSVMTGNIVLWGLAVARGSLSLASHTAVSIAGYVIGVAAGTWVAHGFKATDPGKASPAAASPAAASPAAASPAEASPAAASPAEASPAEASPAAASPAAASPAAASTAEAGDGQDRTSVLPAHVNWALTAELILLAGFTVGWEVTGARPTGWAQFCLLAVLAAAMGVQGSAVNEMGLTNVSTTFLTGTLTGLVSSLVSPGQDTPHGLRRFGVLIGLAAGASLCGLLVATAAAGVPALPLAALITTIVLAAVPLTGREH